MTQFIVVYWFILMVHEQTSQTSWSFLLDVELKGLVENANAGVKL